MIVYAAGVFDLFHVGHLRYLQRSRKLAQRGTLYVGVLTDEATERYKGHKPIIPFAQRIEIISAIKGVDLAIPQHDTNPTENLLKYQPDIFTHGDDDSRDWTYLRKACEKLGIKYRDTKYTVEISTTKLEKTIRENE